MIPSLEILGVGALVATEGAAAREGEVAEAGDQFRDLLENQESPRRPARGRPGTRPGQPGCDEAIIPPVAPAPTHVAAPLPLGLESRATPQTVDVAAEQRTLASLSVVRERSGPTGMNGIALQTSLPPGPSPATLAQQTVLPADTHPQGPAEHGVLPSGLAALASSQVARTHALPEVAATVEGVTPGPESDKGAGDGRPSLQKESGGFAAQHESAAKQGVASPPLPQTTSTAASQPSEIVPNADFPVAISAQQESPKSPASLRSVTSQAQSILFWQAGSVEGLGAAATLLPEDFAQAGFAAAKSADPSSGTPAFLPRQDSDPNATPEDIASPDRLEPEPQLAPGMPQLLPQATPAATTPSTNPLPAPFQPIVQAIHAQARAKGGAKGPEGGTDLMLNPVELGRVHFALSGSGDRLTITITADNPDTQHLLQTHAAELRSELEGAGLGQADLDFAGAGADRGGNRGAFARPQPEAVPASPAEPLADIQTPAPPPRLATGGLDLRL